MTKACHVILILGDVVRGLDNKSMMGQNVVIFPSFPTTLLPLSSSSVMERHSTLQQFKSEWGSPLGSLPTYTFGTSKTGYVLWSDIQNIFDGISHVKREGQRVFLEVDDNYRV